MPLPLCAFLLLCAEPVHPAGVADDNSTTSKSAPLALVQTVALPQITGSINHLAADARRQRFFITAPGEKKVIVVDLKAGKVLQTLAGPAAAAYFLPDLDQLCVSGGQTVTFYEGASLRAVGTVDLDSRLDELQYDAKEKRLYVGMMDADKAGIAVLDASSRTLLAKLKLPAKPQAFVLEANGVRIYANTPAANQVTVLDRKAGAIVAEWKLTDARSNYPIALDEKHHRLFVGCRSPASLLVFDTTSGNRVAAIGTGRDADDMSFDPAAKRVYLACGDGVITTIQQVDADQYRKLPDTPTAAGARNSLLEGDLKTFYLAVPRRDSTPAQLHAYQARN
jgi:DNA-binding beta-propeller fold protein YncE